MNNRTLAVKYVEPMLHFSASDPLENLQQASINESASSAVMTIQICKLLAHGYSYSEISDIISMQQSQIEHNYGRHGQLTEIANLITNAIKNGDEYISIDVQVPNFYTLRTYNFFFEKVPVQFK